MKTSLAVVAGCTVELLITKWVWSLAVMFSMIHFWVGWWGLFPNFQLYEAMIICINKMAKMLFLNYHRYQNTQFLLPVTFLKMCRSDFSSTDTPLFIFYLISVYIPICNFVTSCKTKKQTFQFRRSYILQFISRNPVWEGESLIYGNIHAGSHPKIPQSSP